MLITKSRVNDDGLTNYLGTDLDVEQHSEVPCELFFASELQQRRSALDVSRPVAITVPCLEADRLRAYREGSVWCRFR